jgi:hypothetical protein
VDKKRQGTKKLTTYEVKLCLKKRHGYDGSYDLRSKIMRLRGVLASGKRTA